MSRKLISDNTTYEFNLDAIKNMIASDLGVEVEKITVSYVIQQIGTDPMDRYPGKHQVTKIRVTVDNTL